ncbi:hypothetical protein [Paracraurococcus ruber]|uniref:Uncharacterized protein n=1 Tax=Paracraurococcus ruber TaxID=77675 RepID=A0ABS1CZ96_9PROT|nr:hypothetical protein [Paracraurococcus ruber]MBK1659864.1 hypothetical protein [Paracraurococcus ruber]TDG28965.1 hypothetical protein E2C05_19140 [Paracraurococcus ruber]
MTRDPAGNPPSFTVPFDQLADLQAEGDSPSTNPAAAALDRWQAFFAGARRDDPAFEQLWPIYGAVCDALRFVREADAPPLAAAWQALDEVTRRLPEDDEARQRAEAVMDRIAAITMGQPSARSESAAAVALNLLAFVEFGVRESETAEQVLYRCGKLRRELEAKGEP